jgi:hypothetical protein
MGGREVGALATLLRAHRSLASDADRRELAAFWNSGPIAAAPLAAARSALFATPRTAGSTCSGSSRPTLR